MSERARLTRHQKDIYEVILWRSIRRPDHGAVWVRGADIGSRGALAHLVEKGYVELREDIGSRGGRIDSYRPVHADRCDKPGLHHSDCCCHFDA